MVHQISSMYSKNESWCSWYRKPLPLAGTVATRHSNLLVCCQWLQSKQHFPNVKPNFKSNGSETPFNQHARNVQMTKPLCKQRSLVEIHLHPAVSSPATPVLIYLITVMISNVQLAFSLQRKQLQTKDRNSYLLQL